MEKTVIMKHFISYLCGTDVRHEKHFLIDRSCDPYHSCLILSFRSGALIRTELGMECARPGDCIIHTPEFPQYHAALPEMSGGYRNDWIHAPRTITVPAMKRLHLPFNRLLSTGDPEILTSGIFRIRRELNMQSIFYEEQVELFFREMLCRVARSVCGVSASPHRRSVSEERHYRNIMKIRERLFEHSEEEIGVPDLARQAHLSPERFSTLYRKFFRKTPYRDLLEMRLNRAKSLLISTILPVKEIAAASGWSDEHYFSRLFREQNGVSPTAFREKK